MRRIARAVPILLALAAPAVAQDWPAKPITIVVPTQPGGSLDTLARPLAQRLAEELKHQVVIENKAGAGGIIGAGDVVKAPADGYRVLMGAVHHAIAAHTIKNVPYDSRKDLVGVVRIATVPNALLVPADLPPKTVAEFVAYAKAQGGRLNYATGGVGTTYHLGTEIMKAQGGFEATPVHYRGGAPAMLDVAAGRVQFILETMPSAIQHIQSGKVRILAVTTPKRAPAFPDVPTLAESGFPGFDISTWYGIFAPAGTPKPVLDRLNAAVTAAMARPDMKEMWAKLGAEFAPESAEAFGKFWLAELDRWGAAAKAAKLEPQ